MALEPNFKSLGQFEDVWELGNPYTTPVQPLCMDTTITPFQSTPLVYNSQEITANGLIQYSTHCTLENQTITRHDTTFTEMVVRSVCKTRKISQDGYVYENESILNGHSVADEERNFSCKNDEFHQITHDCTNQSKSTGDHFCYNDWYIEETHCQGFYTSFKPIQFAVEDTEFEFWEDHLQFSWYDFVINFPDQNDVLCKENFNPFIEKIVNFAKENDRLQDTNMLKSSNAFRYQLDVRKTKASVSEMMVLKGCQESRQLSLEDCNSKQYDSSDS